MAFTQSTIRTQFASLIDASPNKITVRIDSTDYDAVKTNLNRDLRYSDFGIQSGYKLSVMISVSDFSTLPSVDDIIEVGNGGDPEAFTQLRIIGIEQDSVDCTIRLDLGEKYA